ncbi:MAG: carbamoyl-phosphate synthase large subunit, partial [Pseudomonadota bacterium]
RLIAQAPRAEMALDEIAAATGFDLWFLQRIDELVAEEAKLVESGLPSDAAGMRRLKQMGFSDARIGALTNLSETAVREARREADVSSVYKRIDTCAAEFEAQTPYMYSTYEADAMGQAECEARPSTAKKIVILGGGPNRIGQGIEFDYCCCHACFALSDAGFETIMINCNPETVSTDYDTSDRLYFEPLSPEHVLEILTKEQAAGTLHGVIVQLGGQTPLKLARELEAAGIPILGTSPDAIDLAEDRDRFKRLLDRLGLRQPQNGIAYSVEQARLVAGDLGLPLVVRPSYVLGGRAMAILQDQRDFDDYILGTIPSLVPEDVKARYPNDKTGQINTVLGKNPLLFDRYLTGAIEVDVDAISDGDQVHIAGVMEHIEEAGIHSGDSACSLPPHSLSAEMVEELERQTHALAIGLEVKGLMNVQFAIQNGMIYVLEVNPRASRTVPFVAKAVGSPLAAIAARVMAGEPLSAFDLVDPDIEHIAVKEAVLPFARFPGVDTLLGPEMRSTGEVMGLDQGFARAFLKSQLGAGTTLPRSGTVFISVRDGDKAAILPAARILEGLGFSLIATGGTAEYLRAQGVAASRIAKVFEGRPNIVDRMKDGDVVLVFNTTEGAQSVRDSFEIRTTALMQKIPYYTTAAGANAAARAIETYNQGAIEVAPLQSFATRS